MITFDYNVGGVKIGQNPDYVIFEWSLTQISLKRGGGIKSAHSNFSITFDLYF